MMNNWLKEVYWGNTVLDYLLVTGGILLAWVVLRLLRGKLVTLLKNLSRRSANHFDDLIVNAIDKYLVPFLYLWVNWVIITQLFLDPKIYRVLNVALIFITTYYTVSLINYLICGGIRLYMEKKNEPPHRINQLNGILTVIKIIIWVVGIIMLIDNLGYNVTTIIAGLGIGGIAIALAAQNILGDLFSYLVIFFDKPFETGDYIVMGNHSGTVEKIGIKTSHVRSPDGQQLVMPNAELAKSVIHNHKRLTRRRVLFTVSVSYQTQPEKLKSIPGIVRAIIEPHEKVVFDRAHFKNLGEYTIDFEIVYFIESADFNFYMDTQQAIMFDLIDRFEKEDIKFGNRSVETLLTKIPGDETGDEGQDN